MPRKKKVEEIKEEVTPMASDAMNPPESDKFMKIVCPSAAVNVRDAAGGNKMFTVPNNAKIGVLEEVEVNGTKWTKICGYVMSEYVKEL